MANLLVSIPWWVSVGLLLAGMVTLVYANRRNQAHLRTAGLIAVSLAILLGAARFLIDTDAEKCERRTRDLVDCVAKPDWPKLQNLLDNETYVDLGSKFPKLKGPKDIRAYGEALAKSSGLKSASIWSLKTEQTPGDITVLFTAYTQQDATQDRAMPSDWEFDYHISSGQWHLTEIKMLSLANESTQ